MGGVPWHVVAEYPTIWEFGDTVFLTAIFARLISCQMAPGSRERHNWVLTPKNMVPYLIQEMI